MNKNLLKVASVFFIGAGVLVSAQDTKGKVGVNTEKPSATLNVKSLTGKDGSTKNFELENASSTKMFTVLDNGRIGINKSKPVNLLHIAATDDSFDANHIVFENYRNSGSNSNLLAESGILFKRFSGTPDNIKPVAIGELLGDITWSPFTPAGTLAYDGTTNANFGQVGYLSAVYAGVAKDAHGVKAQTGHMMFRSRISVNEEFRGLIVKNIGYVGINTPVVNNSYLPKENSIPETLTVNGAIKVGNKVLAEDGGAFSNYTILGNNPSTPRGGAGTMVYDDANNHFYGYVGGVNKWIQLDNEASSSEVKVPNNKTLKCNASNAGIINFGDVTVGGKSLQAFGFCMKDSSNKYRWFYIYGASNVTSGEEGDFGAGL